MFSGKEGFLRVGPENNIIKTMASIVEKVKLTSPTAIAFLSSGDLHISHLTFLSCFSPSPGRISAGLSMTIVIYIVDDDWNVLNAQRLSHEQEMPDIAQIDYNISRRQQDHLKQE